MRTNQTTGLGLIREALSNIWGRFSLRLALCGFAFVLAGYVMQTGVWAGLFPIWGAALIAVGLSAFCLTWYTYR
ncbi:hypothetical protein ACFQMA_16895 [Halosimplex aquaticum]|uniref:Uncharacterized protein n=1 Tax=Halosimplex aquaticum TaxID=3026162 RepID=A0ABD5Y2K6_9EURY|nr:hypothetical protein [Halosimplex aquaticum]